LLGILHHRFFSRAPWLEKRGKKMRGPGLEWEIFSVDGMKLLHADHPVADLTLKAPPQALE